MNKEMIRPQITAYGGERVPVALVLRTDRVGRRDQRHQNYLKNYKKALYTSLPIIALDFGITSSFLLRIPAFPFETIPQSIHTDCMLQMLLHKLRLSANLVLIP